MFAYPLVSPSWNGGEHTHKRSYGLYEPSNILVFHRFCFQTEFQASCLQPLSLPYFSQGDLVTDREEGTRLSDPCKKTVSYQLCKIIRRKYAFKARSVFLIHIPPTTFRETRLTREFYFLPVSSSCGCLLFLSFVKCI